MSGPAKKMSDSSSGSTEVYNKSTINRLALACRRTAETARQSVAANQINRP